MARQNCHGNIAEQAVCPREHVYNAALQMNQAVSIRADPESPITVGVETTRKDVGNGSILDHVSGDAVHSGSQNSPQMALLVLIGSKGSRCGRTKWTQPRQRLLAPPQNAFVSGIPHRSVSLFEYVKDVSFRPTQSCCEIWMRTSFVTVPFAHFSFVYEKQV